MGLACGTVLFFKGVLTGIIDILLAGAVAGGAASGLLVGGMAGLAVGVAVFLLGSYLAINFALKHIGLIALLTVLPFLLC
ncbi:MAG: hypothetical protein SVU88_02990 [Candidatus Nanohaloarchaea archaeon]|nr:hypothetical protein [Candidatus Nanohaloarchaea archaeon]